jgi:hypothetical protein
MGSRRSLMRRADQKDFSNTQDFEPAALCVRCVEDPLKPIGQDRRQLVETASVD